MGNFLILCWYYRLIIFAMRQLKFALSGFFIFLFCPFLFGHENQANTQNESHPAVGFLSQYIQIPSVSGNEKEAGMFFAEACRQEGLHVRVFTDDIDSYNFAASLYPLSSGKPNIIFLTHIDVVPEGDITQWTHPPYGGVIADGHVWGRGAIDNKGHGVMQFFALKSFVEKASEMDLPYNFTMLAVSNEEMYGDLGAGLVTKLFFDELNAVAVYGEGGVGIAGVVNAQPELVLFGIEVAQKRALWFRIEASDATSGHGSMPLDVYPASQVVQAANAILNQKSKVTIVPSVQNMFHAIGTHERGLRKLALKNIRCFAPFIAGQLRDDEFTRTLVTNTISLTNLGGGDGAYNQMAQEAWATFDARLLPGVTTEDFLANIKKSISDYEVELKIIAELPPSPESERGIYYKALEQAVLENFSDASVGPILFPAINDLLYFRRLGVPSYGLVPAILDAEHIFSIHNIDERLPITGLIDGIEVYISLINLLIR
jgi:carboxypeptidase PM20D1